MYSGDFDKKKLLNYKLNDWLIDENGWKEYRMYSRRWIVIALKKITTHMWCKHKLRFRRDIKHINCAEKI